MNVLKGFIVIQSLLSNEPEEVAQFGEISTWSMTYTKERGEYHDPAVPGYRLVSARCFNRDTGPIEAPQSLVNETIEMAVEVMRFVTQTMRPYNREVFLNTLMARFDTRAYQIRIGPIDNGDTLGMPQWISWISEQHDNTFIRIWFSDEAFADQYDEYETTVIAPLEDLNDFFLLPGEVKTRIESRSFEDMMILVQEAKQRHPETYIRSLSFDYIPPNQTAPVKTHWNILIYGAAGDNIDSIKDAFIDYVLEHSDHPRHEWERILPSLFKRTEFILVPRWDKYAIPNLLHEQGLYSSLTEPLEMVAFLKEQVEFYPPVHVERNITIFPHDYKMLTIGVVNGVNNVEGKTHFDRLFDDYLPIASTSLDFNRMRIATREWLLLLQEMLIVAETMDEYTPVPRKFRRIFRNHQLYITMVYNNIHFLVLSKTQLIQNLTP